MRMGIKMLFAILIIAVALGTEPELKIRVVYLGPSTDRTLVLGNPGISPHIPLKLLPPVDLFGI